MVSVLWLCTGYGCDPTAKPPPAPHEFWQHGRASRPQLPICFMPVGHRATRHKALFLKQVVKSVTSSVKPGTGHTDTRRKARRR